MAMMGKIRRMYFRDKLSVSEIARRTSLARNTIKKWLRAPRGVEPRYQRVAKPGKLTPFHAQLIQALEADAHRPKRERRSALTLKAQISEQGYNGGYTRVADFVRAWRACTGKALASRAFVPLTFALGEAFQFDWSEEGLVIGGIYRRLQVAHLKLCASRAFWLVAYLSQGHEMLFDAHTRACGTGGRSKTRHLRQHEDRCRSRAEGQGTRDQRALREFMRALSVRRRLL
jgi:transposase